MHRLAFAGLFAVAACTSPLPPLEGEDLAVANKAVAALENASVEQRGRIAAAALAEIEAKRMPQRLVEAFAAVSAKSVDEHQTNVILASTIEHHLTSEWKDACEESEVFTSVWGKSVDNADKVKIVYKGCRFDRLGLIPEAEAEKAGFGWFAAAHLAFDYLQRRKSLSEPERKLLEAFARNPPPPPR